MLEEARNELGRTTKEVAAGTEEKTVDFGAYLLAERINDLKVDLQRQLTEVKQDIGNLRQETNSLRQEMNSLRQETSSLRQEMNSLRQETSSLRQEMNGLRQEMRQEIGRLDGKIDGLRQELKEDIKHIDGKINNIIWAAVGTFFAVLVGAAAIVVAIYYTVPR
ncbi:MAG TPA: hypothetical protein DEA73_03280 [Peptococcaceae bacterium]|nr:hypothetical protein [Peptococcaceae bacterium]